MALKFMKKLLMGFILAIISMGGRAEINSRWLSCIPNESQNPSFKVSLGNGYALVNMKENIYKIPYKEFYIDESGDKRVVYENNLLRLNHTPRDKYSSIGINPTSNYKIISSAFCQ